MDYQKIETKMKESYAAVARLYRNNDERDATGPDHQRIGSILSSLCHSFRRPISVLDIGCGTGRYFHCLSNVLKLTGMDVSQAMLEEARYPVCAKDISAAEIELVCGNFYTANFKPGSFDFIYSLGVFGNGCALTPELFNKFHRWLSPDGCLFLDAIDSSGDPWMKRMRRQLKRLVYQRLPNRLQNAWDERSGWLPFFVTSRPHLEGLLRKTRFRYFSVESNAYSLPTGAGRKLECLASKIQRAMQPASLTPLAISQ